MELDDSTDVLMHDGGVLYSTEDHPETIDAAYDAALRPELKTVTNDIFGEVTKQAAIPALKGPNGKQNEQLLDDRLNPKEDIPRPAKFKNLPYATAQTGLVYDVRMRFHVELYPTEDEVHPEDPRRIHSIFEALVNAGLVWHKGSEGSSNYYMGRIATREVRKEEVCRVHTEKHWNWIQSLKHMGASELVNELQHPGQYTQMDSVYLSPSTPFCAALSAGGAIEAVRAIMLGRVKNAFAVIRPPGHHAEREDVKGFCFYDNVSIATKASQIEFGAACRKVLILDWDVHHGNGIQQAHYGDPNVLYISLHVHRNGTFYPEGSYRDRRPPFGDYKHCGEGAGIGKNVNIPWRNHGMGDADYIYAFQQIVMPIATEFDPDLVMIAAGFDAADGDMLGGCHVTPAGYAHMTHMLMSLAKGKIAVCLEGGYNLQSIAVSATAVARTLMGEPPERLQDLDPMASAVDDIKTVVRQQSKFWASLHPKDLSDRLQKMPPNSERMHDVVRKWQASALWDEHEMAPLSVNRDRLSKSFEDQILATPHYMEARPLLVILHDPPEVLASPDPRTGKIELHNTWLTDIVKTYVDWAVKHDFGVIDVNLPKHITSDESDTEHEELDSVEHRTKEATELLTYLWDNYIELSDSTHVILMGTNTGHGAIINFIKANEQRAQEKLDKAISFVQDVPLQSCKSSTNDGLAPWYYSSSLVFVASEHNFWSSDYARKPKKRFGKVERSSEDAISDMLDVHKDQIIGMLSSLTDGWRDLVPPVDAVQDDEAEGQRKPLEAEPVRMPPMSNFAPQKSPPTFMSGMESSALPLANNFASPSRSGNGAPPISNFATSPRQRPD